MVTSKKTNHIKMHLDSRELLALRQRRSGMTIECDQGVLWITCPQDFGDHILIPGDRYNTHGRGKVLVEALRDASFRLSNQN